MRRQHRSGCGWNPRSRRQEIRLRDARAVGDESFAARLAELRDAVVRLGVTGSGLDPRDPAWQRMATALSWIDAALDQLDELDGDL